MKSFIRRLTLTEAKYHFIILAPAIPRLFPTAGNLIGLQLNGVQLKVRIDKYGRIWVGRLLTKAGITLVPGISASLVPNGKQNFLLSFSNYRGSR